MKKPVWKRLWARKYAPFLASAFILSYLKNKQFGTAPNKMFVPEGNLMAYYFEQSEFYNLARNYEKFLNRQNLKVYAKRYEREFQNFLAYAKQVSRIDPTATAPTKLAKIITEFNTRLIQSSDYQFYAFLVLEGPGVDLEKKLSSMADGSRRLTAITTPYKLTQINQARLELEKIAQTNNRKALAKYAKKYAWLPVYEPLDKPWTLSNFKAQVNAIRRERDAATAHNHREAAFQNYLAGISDKRLKKQAEIVHYFSYLKEMRDDYRRQAYYLIRPFLEKIAKSISLSFTEINYLSIPEVAASVASGSAVVSRQELMARQKAFAFYLKDGKLIIYSGPRARRLGLKLQDRGRNKIIGSPASPGLVRGKASIIYHQGEFAKFKSGQILVTTMTHPEFLPIMKQAKAIVTDEGGITCHAAIVARELGIPCIIGTKNATQILHDGDLVEVDANQGIVRKI